MGIQPSRTKTRIRTKRSQGVPYEVAAPLSPATLLEQTYAEAGVCCFPVTIGTFENEALVRLEQRHMGRRCAGKTEHVDIREWRHGKAN